MPAKKAASALEAKYGNRLDGAVAEHANDETKAGIIKLPGGIKNGVAQLVECYFAPYKSGPNEGEFYFRAAATVLEPAVVPTDQGDMPVAGLQTSVMVAMCDTKNKKGKVTPFKENVARVLNHMRLLGGDEFTKDVKSVKELEVLADALVKAAPIFKFTTSQSAPTDDYPDPQVFENWHGSKGLEEYTAPSPESNGQQRDNSGKGAPVANAKSASSTGPADNADGAGSQNLAELAEKADGGDDPAMDELRRIATEAGLSEDEIDGTDNYAELVGLIEGKQSGAAAPDNAWAGPDIGDSFYYQVKDAQGNPLKDKRTKKPIKPECVVTAINKAKETCTLKNGGDNKTLYKDVPWDELEGKPS